MTVNVSVAPVAVVDPGNYDPSPMTPKELTFLQKPKVLTWFDARGYNDEIDGSDQLTQWRSKKLIGSLQPQLSCDQAQAIYGKYYPTPGDPTGDFEITPGFDLADAAIVGVNHKQWFGNPYFRIPATGDLTIFMFARVKTGNTNVFIASNATDTNFVILSTAALKARVYANYSASPVESTLALPDNGYVLQVYKFNRSTNQLTMFFNDTSARASAAFTLPAYTDPVLNLGFLIEGATPTTNAGIGFMGVGLIASIDDADGLAAYKDILDERGLWAP